MELIDKIIVSDVTGKVIYQKNNVDAKEFSVLNLMANQQMLLVKITLQNGAVIAKKIVY